MEIFAQPNATANGFNIPSEFHKARLLDWFKKYNRFTISPVVEDSANRRGYLEGAVIPSYCQWQYGIDRRATNQAENRRYLFKRDFNGEIVKNKDGNPEVIPMSTKGMTKVLLDKYTEWATENGAPIPNPALYKQWRDEFSMELRFQTFQDWLDFLGIEEDAMPSAETIAKARVN